MEVEPGDIDPRQYPRNDLNLSKYDFDWIHPAVPEFVAIIEINVG
jgi:hypothetical protein